MKVIDHLAVVHNAIKDLNNEPGIHSGLPFELFLRPGLFNSYISQQVMQYLDSLKQVYQYQNNIASREKDEIYLALEKQVGGKDAIVDFHNQYVNRSITDLVLNRNQLHKIFEYDNQLIQRMDPIFEIPEASI